jgi:hypothetical protein
MYNRQVLMYQDRVSSFIHGIQYIRTLLYFLIYTDIVSQPGFPLSIRHAENISLQLPHYTSEIVSENM